MANGERTLSSMAKRDKFMATLRQSKEEGLHSRHGDSKPSGGASGSLPSQESGSRISQRVSKSGRRVIFVLDDDEASEEEKEENSTAFESDEPEDEASSCRKNQRRKEVMVLLPPPKMKAPGQSSTSGRNLQVAEMTRGDSKSALELQRKEIEMLKRRAETAEGNFVALVGRVQDFRTSLRSEIRTMPPGAESDGLSRLSAAMETAIDDAGLYLRNISDPLKQSRINWEIHNGAETKVHNAKELEGESKPQPRTGAQRQIQRSRSPSPIHPKGPADGKVGKGKRKAVELSEDDEEEVQKKYRGIDEDWEDWEVAAAPKIPDGQLKIVHSRPTSKRTGDFFDKPCSTCVLEGKKCEKNKNGRACVQCNAKKRRCEYSQVGQAKKNKAKGGK